MKEHGSDRMQRNEAARKEQGAIDKRETRETIRVYPSISCPKCKSTATVYADTAKRGVPGAVHEIRRCRRCGMKWARPRGTDGPSASAEEN